jgi:hypothetical protein
MATNRSLIEKEVDRLFSEIKAEHGQSCINPVHKGGFNWGVDPIKEQKEAAIVALLAREYFAVNGPLDAPQLPLNIDDRDSYRSAGGLKGVVGFYARSLYAQGYDVRKHPSFFDFACGLMALAVVKGLWNLEKDETLLRRFPPRPLPGMTPSAYWQPAEQYEKTTTSCRRASGARHLVLVSSRAD